jgi:hypothetical protein
MKTIFLSFIFIINIISAKKLTAQTGVAINTDGAAADGSAMLDVKATDKGILIPRITLTSSVITPVNGLLVYQTGGTPGFYYYNGSAWIFIQNSGNANLTLQENTFNGASQLLQLNASAQVATAILGTGAANSTTFLRGDGSWAAPVGSAGPSNLFSNLLPATVATRYGSIFGTASNATEAVVSVRFAVGCIVSNLTVSVVDGASAYPYTGLNQTAATLGVWVNGANALVCTTSNSSSCTNAGTYTINAGDMVNFIISGLSNASNAVVRFSARCQY